MKQLISQKDLLPPLPEYVELEGKGHWFDGVMATPSLLQFYRDVLAGRLTKTVAPQKFSVMVADPADMGSKYGLVVDQKLCSDQLGRLDVLTDNIGVIWQLQTSNVLRFHIDIESIMGNAPKTVVIDGHAVNLPSESNKTEFTFSQSRNGSWSVRCMPLRLLVCH